MDELSNLLNLGVAVAISIYLVGWMTRVLSEKVDRLTDVVNSLVEVVRELRYEVRGTNRNDCPNG